MIYYSHIYVQSSSAFFQAQQLEVFANVYHLPEDDPVIVDLQAAYWMGGEL